MPVERLIFAMVANRVLAPSSKLGMESWVAEEALSDGLPEVEVRQLYRAMDFLIEAGDQVQFGVFSAVADLINLEVDLMFLDTTNAFFETEVRTRARKASGIGASARTSAPTWPRWPASP